MLGETTITTDASQNSAVDTAVGPVASAEALVWMTPAQRHSLLAESVRDDVAALCAIPRVEDVDVERPLADFGLDDLGSEMLRCSLESLLHTTLSDELELHHVSARKVAIWALRQWSPADARPAGMLLH